jgi:hypothetical protein
MLAPATSHPLTQHSKSSAENTKSRFSTTCGESVSSLRLRRRSRLGSSSWAFFSIVANQRLIKNVPSVSTCNCLPRRPPRCRNASGSWKYEGCARWRRRKTTSGLAYNDWREPAHPKQVFLPSGIFLCLCLEHRSRVHQVLRNHDEERRVDGKHALTKDRSSTSQRLPETRGHPGSYCIRRRDQGFGSPTVACHPGRTPRRVFLPQLSATVVDGLDTAKDIIQSEFPRGEYQPGTLPPGSM